MEQMNCRWRQNWFICNQEGSQWKLQGKGQNLLRIVQKLKDNERPEACAICNNAYSSIETHIPLQPRKTFFPNKIGKKSMIQKLRFMGEAVLRVTEK